MSTIVAKITSCWRVVSASCICKGICVLSMRWSGVMQDFPPYSVELCVGVWLQHRCHPSCCWCVVPCYWQHDASLGGSISHGAVQRVCGVILSAAEVVQAASCRGRMVSWQMPGRTPRQHRNSNHLSAGRISLMPEEMFGTGLYPDMVT